ncbi:hypothetical protein XENORESO_012704 [Xenotaenia resolanae]|uniref:Stimulator of interferon genes protein n=1 Tax=Xenotaenia resolanae TaxID=208358 RepID=A0ABV0WR68_9TELE
MAGLLLYLTRHSLLHKGQSWEHIVLVPVLYTMFKSLGVLGPSEVEVSDIAEERKMNVAHGLAWSFYLGYLQLVLPCLEKSFDTFHASHHDSFRVRGSQKLLILIPLNANISHRLEDEDNYIKFYDSLLNSELDRAGVRGRVYKHSVYRVQDERGKIRRSSQVQRCIEAVFNKIIRETCSYHSTIAGAQSNSSFSLLVEAEIQP